MPSPFTAFVAVAATAIVATAALGLSGWQFRTERRLVAADADELDASHWHAIGAPADAYAVPGGMRIANVTQDTIQVRRRVPLPPVEDSLGPRWVRFVARVDGEILAFAPGDHRHPIVASWFENDEGERVKVAPGELPRGTIRARRWSEVRDRPEGVTHAAVGMFLRGAEGHLSIRELRIETVALSSPYLVSAASLIVAWLVLGAVALRTLRRRIAWRDALLPGTLALCIGLLVALSSNMIDTLVLGPIALVLGADAALALENTFTAGHGLAFALLTLSLLAARSRFGLTSLQAIVLVALLSVASEILQLHLPSRNTQFDDLLADALGILAGVMLWLAARALVGRRRHVRDDRTTPEIEVEPEQRL